ncbi:MAG TPA: hypothetical protein VGD78_02760 [Chthoniobacterales bacterium]
MPGGTWHFLGDVYRPRFANEVQAGAPGTPSVALGPSERDGFDLEARVVVYRSGQRSLSLFGSYSALRARLLGRAGGSSIPNVADFLGMTTLLLSASAHDLVLVPQGETGVAIRFGHPGEYEPADLPRLIKLDAYAGGEDKPVSLLEVKPVKTGVDGWAKGSSPPSEKTLTGWWSSNWKSSRKAIPSRSNLAISLP